MPGAALFGTSRWRSSPVWRVFGGGLQWWHLFGYFEGPVESCPHNFEGLVVHFVAAYRCEP